MLKLDDDTRAIPVLTYTTSSESEDEEEDDTEPEDDAMFAPKVAARMN
jgi:hypothetical protein